MTGAPTAKDLAEHAGKIMAARRRLRDEMAKVAAEVAAKPAPTVPETGQ